MLKTPFFVLIYTKNRSSKKTAIFQNGEKNIVGWNYND